MQLTITRIISHDKIELERALKLESASARIEVQCLLQHVLNVSRAYLFAHPELILSGEMLAFYQALKQRRLSGEPIAYILGEREFFGLSFRVTSATLIPRPETELLVEMALERIPAFSKQGSAFEAVDLRILDLGTGSGAIALAIAHQSPHCDVWACDASAPALAVAQENAQRLNISNAHFIESNWFSALTGQQFDIILSNPPYIAENDGHLSQGDVRFEPLTALVSGVDGLDDIRGIIAQSAAFLRTNGWLLLEHGYDQAAQVRSLLQQSGFIEVFSTKDLSGIERCSGGQLHQFAQVA